jgi:hypothetical protein
MLVSMGSAHKKLSAALNKQVPYALLQGGSLNLFLLSGYLLYKEAR